MRTLRHAHCLAGPPLPGMRRPAPRVCERPRRRLALQPGSLVDHQVEAVDAHAEVGQPHHGDALALRLQLGRHELLVVEQRVDPVVEQCRAALVDLALADPAAVDAVGRQQGAEFVDRGAAGHQPDPLTHQVARRVDAVLGA